MRPIVLVQLSGEIRFGELDSRWTNRVRCRATPYSIASSRTLCVSSHASDVSHLALRRARSRVRWSCLLGRV